MAGGARDLRPEMLRLLRRWPGVLLKSTSRLTFAGASASSFG
jgi:hypothetical protein